MPVGTHSNFSRRIGSVLATGPDGQLLIVKGAPEAMLALCTTQRKGVEVLAMDEKGRTEAMNRIHALAQDGFRAIAVASRPWAGQLLDIGLADETELLSGDDPIVLKRLAGLVGLKADKILSGNEIAALSDEALAVQVQSIDAYGRLAPDQKSRIVKALQSKGAIVGFLGDGINDAPGLMAADVGLSVEGATGVAQAAADMILLASDLEVVAEGVEEGRRTFANILKYVRMGASSNFGNML